MNAVLSKNDKEKWLNEHLVYRYLKLIGCLIEQKTGRWDRYADIKHNYPYKEIDHIRIALIESSYIAADAFNCFLLKQKFNRNNDITSLTLGGKAIEDTDFKVGDQELINSIKVIRDKHVAHFTNDFVPDSDECLIRGIEMVNRFIKQAMPSVTGFENSKFNQLITEINLS